MTPASDGAGGAIAAWDDTRSPGNLDVFAQRVNGAGVSGNNDLLGRVDVSGLADLPSGGIAAEFGNLF